MRGPTGRIGRRWAGVTAAAVFIVTVALVVLLAVLFHVAWPPVLVALVGTLPALYLAWLAVPGVVNPSEPVESKKLLSSTDDTAKPVTSPSSVAPRHPPLSVVFGALGLVASLAATTLLVDRWWAKVLVWTISALLILASLVIDLRKADQKRTTSERTEQSARSAGFSLSAPDLDKLSDERIQLLRCSVKVLEEMVAASAAIAHATPLSADFDKVSVRMQRSLEQTQVQLLELQKDVNVAANWPDRKWAMGFSAARGRAQQKIASLDWQLDRTTASGLSAARQQDTQLRGSIEKLLSLLRNQYPSLFIG